MKFCEYLMRDINFEPAGIQPCCDVHAIGVPSYSFAGGALDVQSYKEHITNVFNSLQNSAEVCKGCSYLKDAEISFEPGQSQAVGDYLKIQSVSFNQHRFFCNCRCVYCALWSKKDKGTVYSVLPAVKSLVASGILHKKCFFSWGGGEPSILSEFDEVCSWIHSQGYFQYVHTSALHYSPSIGHLLSAGAGRINISLDSGSSAVYEQVKGVNGWNKVLSTLEKYLTEGQNPGQIDMKYIVFDMTNQLKEIGSFLTLCQALSIRNVQYSLDFREVNAGQVSQKTLLGVAFLRRRAKELGLNARAFFIDDVFIKRVEAIEKNL